MEGNCQQGRKGTAHFLMLKALIQVRYVGKKGKWKDLSFSSDKMIIREGFYWLIDW